jgi:hypothetical protein
VVGIACVVESGPFTVSVKFFADTAPAASVTVTVNTVAAMAAVGVPLTVPVVVLNERPVGSDASGVSANAYGVVPPAAVTGMKSGSTSPLLPTRLGTACVVVRAGFTVSVNV